MFGAGSITAELAADADGRGLGRSHGGGGHGRSGRRPDLLIEFERSRQTFVEKVAAAR
jgi:hypothetical protein